MNSMDYSSYTRNPYYPMPGAGGYSGSAPTNSGYAYMDDSQRSGSAASGSATKAFAGIAGAGLAAVGTVAAFQNPKAAGKLVKGGLESAGKVAKSPFKAVGKAFEGAKGLAKKGWEGLTSLFKKAPSDEALRKAQPEGPRRIEITSPNDGPRNIPITGDDAVASKPVVPTTIKPKQIELEDAEPKPTYKNGSEKQFFESGVERPQLKTPAPRKM